MNILEIVSAPFVSSGIGIIGAYFTRMEERKMQKEKNAFELANKKLDNEMLLQQKDKDMEIQDMTDRGEAFSKSQESGITKGMDFARSIMRPFITLYIMLIVSWLTWLTYSMVSEDTTINPSFMVELFEYAVISLISLNTMVISWWFGSRPSGSLTLFNPKSKTLTPKKVKTDI